MRKPTLKRQRTIEDDDALHAATEPAPRTTAHAAPMAAPVTAPVTAPELASEAVPPSAPLFMPTQNLAAPGSARARSGHALRVFIARAITFGGALALTLFGANEMLFVVEAGGITLLEYVFLGFFIVTFGWIGFAASAAIAGVAAGAMRWIDRRSTGAETEAAKRPLERVALVMPIYNEDPSRTCAALEAMALGLDGEAGIDPALCERSAQREPRARDAGPTRYEIFLISDTTDPEVLVQETAAAAELARRLAARGEGGLRVFYRHRWSNVGRKAGNVREFVEQWGGRYDAMLVLDADSVMSADTIVALVEALQEDPSIGLVQSVPSLAGGRTPFARLQQFAGSVYGPVVSSGLAAWQGDDGNYWGHNALIRTRAFAEAAGLPELAGKRPFGGAILSHDFVEAALLRKAGWRVRLLPELEGSWEDSPPSLLDAAVRDRRWAQGNVQHLALVARRGLAWPSRVHLLNGFMSYAASPLWLCLVVVGIALSLQAGVAEPDYFGDGPTLFPSWPTFDSERMLRLFLISALVLFLPKIIGTVATLASRRRRVAHGGGPRFLASVAIELVVSTLIAPIMMLVHSNALWQIARGQDSGWNLQERDGRVLAWRTVLKRHRTHMLIGIGLSVLLLFTAPNVLPWMAPILIGLALAAPLSRWTSDPRISTRLGAHRLLRTPAEHERPDSFRLRELVLPHYRDTVGALDPEAVLLDPDMRERHYACVPELPPTPRGAPDSARLGARAKLEEASSLAEALGWLERRELVALLCDRSLAERAIELIVADERAASRADAR